jgi:hypothetical protein
VQRLAERSAENRDAENDYACMNGPSREQHTGNRRQCSRAQLQTLIVDSGSLVLVFGLHRASALLRRMPLESRRPVRPHIADAEPDASSERHRRHATIRASGIRIGRRNENFRRHVQPQ